MPEQYLVSFYWSLTTLTTVGYGDVTPVTDAERKYAVFALFAGALVFATVVRHAFAPPATQPRRRHAVARALDSPRRRRSSCARALDSPRRRSSCARALVWWQVGDITSTLEKLNRQQTEVEERMASLKEYLAWRQIPRDLALRIKRYYEY